MIACRVVIWCFSLGFECIVLVLFDWFCWCGFVLLVVGALDAG